MTDAKAEAIGSALGMGIAGGSFLLAVVIWRPVWHSVFKPYTHTSESAPVVDQIVAGLAHGAMLFFILIAAAIMIVSYFALKLLLEKAETHREVHG